MKRYLYLFLGLATALLVLFGIGMLILPASWHDPSDWLRAGYVSGGVIGVGLLILDVLLPVPSTLVMTALGMIHGIWVGATLSLIGNVGAAAFGFWLGRRSDGVLDRFLSDDDRIASSDFLNDWGEVGIILSRPIPILAESVAMLAGTSPAITWSQLVRSTFIGALPASFIYAWAGAQAVSLQSGILVFCGVILLAFIFLQISKRYYRRKKLQSSD
jgi:uncharacterized membrane protein YdjX (TVP38/TMEM64 family)